VVGLAVGAVAAWIISKRLKIEVVPDEQS
jgi:hypothetical protein